MSDVSKCVSLMSQTRCTRLLEQGADPNQFVLAQTSSPSHHPRPVTLAMMIECLRWWGCFIAIRFFCPDTICMCAYRHSKDIRWQNCFIDETENGEDGPHALAQLHASVFMFRLFLFSFRTRATTLVVVVVVN